jgi:hypothetical protein
MKNRLLAVFVLPVCLLAQSDLATLRGTATDPTGAVAPRVKIELLDLGTNTSRDVLTSSSGDFEIPYVSPGTYRLTATSPGFRTFVADNVIIRAREMRRVDVTLELGAVGAEVTVTAGAANISTEGSQISGGFTREAWVDSPLSQSFFPQAYMTTLPNIQTQQGSFTIRFAGQPSNQVAENLDGVTSDGTVNLVQNMQDFEDLQVVAVNNSAEFSRVAQFSMASKGGSNQFHGRVYYDLINSALQARRYFDPKKTPYKEHRGGANASGPVIRNKMFFYGGYSLVRIPSASFYLRDVPTLNFRGGDFSDLLTQRPAMQLVDPLNNKQPFPGNIIPANRIHPTSQKVQDLYIPKPNVGSPNSTFQNYGFLFPHPTDLYRWDSVTARLDYYFSSKNQIFGRFINRLTPYILNGPYENLGTWTRKRDHHSIVVTDTHTFSPRLVHQFFWGWIKDYYIDGDTTGGFTPQKGDEAVKAIGLQGVNRQGFSAMGFPRMDFTGLTTIRQNPGGVNLDQRHFEYSDSVTWSVGRHVMKYGAELRTFRDFNGSVPEGNYGTFNFTGSLTGNGYADFLLGLPFTSTRLDPLTNRTQRAYELGVFATDTFKVSRRLTLDYGLRWDYFRHARYEDGLQYNWDPATGNVIVPQEARSKVSPLYSPNIAIVTGNVYPTPSRKNFRPRLGVAYRLREDLVIRGGYGIYSEALGNYHRAQGAGPFQIAETYTNNDLNRLFSFPNPFPTSLSGAAIPSQSVSGYPLDTTNGSIHQFNVSIEKEFAKMFGTRVSYIGSRSRSLNYSLSLNKPRPSLTPFTQARRPWSQYVGVSYVQTDGSSNYDALQFEIQKKMGAIVLDAHYTYSSAMNNFSDLENPYDHNFWNRDSFNSRHRAVINATWNVPVGKGKHYLSTAPAVVDAALGGWQLGWISYFQSGQYFTPSFSGSDPSNTNSVGGLPDRIRDGNLAPGERQPNRWFDPSAFAPPPPGRFGNSGVNILEGPGMNLHHLSAIKEFHLSERWKFVLQGMLTNLFNHPHFDFPNANISVPNSVARVFQLRDGGSGGREMSGARQVQFRFRLEF